MLQTTVIHGRIWLKTPRSRKNGVQASILLPKSTGQSSQAAHGGRNRPFLLREKLSLPRGLLPCPWTSDHSSSMDCLRLITRQSWQLQHDGDSSPIPLSQTRVNLPTIFSC